MISLRDFLLTLGAFAVPYVLLSYFGLMTDLVVVVLFVVWLVYLIVLCAVAGKRLGWFE